MKSPGEYATEAEALASPMASAQVHATLAVAAAIQELTEAIREDRVEEPLDFSGILQELGIAPNQQGRAETST